MNTRGDWSGWDEPCPCDVHLCRDWLSPRAFGEFGAPDSGYADKIMHGMLETDSGFTLMGADTPPEMNTTLETTSR